MQQTPIQQRYTIPLLILISSIALLGLILWFSPLNTLDANANADAIGDWLATFGATGMLVLLLGGTAATAIGIPRQLIALVSGIGFGLVHGLALAMVACSLGAMTTFWVSRYLARPWVRRRLPVLAETLQRFTAKQAFLKIIIIRFLPVGTNMLTNLAAGATQIKARVFFTASLLGFLPQTTIFVLIGNGLKVKSTDQLLLAAALTVIAILLSAWVYRKHRAELAVARQ